jgi:hypothetical protein
MRYADFSPAEKFRKMRNRIVLSNMAKQAGEHGSWRPEKNLLLHRVM